VIKKILMVLLPLVGGIVLFAAIFSASAKTTTVSESTLIEYPIPTTNGGPQSIAVQAPGHVWFTLPQENAIGELVVTSTVDYTFHIHPVPTSNSEPYDLVFDGTYIWFTERAGNKLGQLHTVTKIITETTLTPASSMPTSIDIAPNGDIWITKPGTNTGNISRYTPGTAAFQNYTYTNATNPAADPQDITVLSDGRVGFTVPTMNIVVELSFNPTVFSEILVNDIGVPSFPPGGITDDGQSFWVSAPTKSWIGRYGTGTLGNFLWKSLASNEAAPTALHYRSESSLRQLWYVGTASDHIGNLVIDADGKKVSSLDFILPQTNSSPTDIAVDNNGYAWITESGSNKIALWRPPYVVPVYLPIVIK
jgi:virginiamycin B lyase